MAALEVEAVAHLSDPCLEEAAKASADSLPALLRCFALAVVSGLAQLDGAVDGIGKADRNDGAIVELNEGPIDQLSIDATLTLGARHRRRRFLWCHRDSATHIADRRSSRDGREANVSAALAESPSSLLASVSSLASVNSWLPLLLGFHHRRQHPVDGRRRVAHFESAGAPQVFTQNGGCVARTPRAVRMVVRQAEQFAPVPERLLRLADAACPEGVGHHRRWPVVAEALRENTVTQDPQSGADLGMPRLLTR